MFYVFVFSNDVYYRHCLATYADPFDLFIKNSSTVKTLFRECCVFFTCKAYCAAEGGLIFFARAVPAAILCGWKGRRTPLNLL